MKQKKVKVSKKKMIQEIIRLEAWIKNDENRVNAYITHAIEQISDAKGKDKTALRNRYFKDMAVLLDFTEAEELKALKVMLKKKPVKVDKDDKSKEI